MVATGLSVVRRIPERLTEVPKFVKLLGRRAGFFLPTASQGLVTVITVPIIFGAVGARTWGEVAVAQAVGGFFAVAVSLGWFVSGPNKLAHSGDEAGAWRTLADSCVTKGAMLVPVAMLSVGMASLVTQQFSALIAFSALGTLTLGLSQSWFFASTDAPWTLFLMETVPKSVVGLLVWGGVWFGWLGPTVAMGLQGLAVLTGFLLTWRMAEGLSGRSGGPTLSSILGLLRGQVSGIWVQFPAVLFSYAPVVMVSVLWSDMTSGFALVDKGLKLFATGMSPVVSMLLAGLSVIRNPRERVRVAVARILMVCLVMLPLSCVVTRPLLSWLSGGAVQVDIVVALLVGLCVVLNFFVVAWPPMVMAPLGSLRWAAFASTIGSVLGLASVALMGEMWGLAGILTGISTGFGSVALMSCARVVAIWRVGWGRAV